MSNAALKKHITKYFSFAEIQTLCFDLNINHDKLTHNATIDELTEYLITQCDNKNQRKRLIKKINQKLPYTLYTESPASNRLAILITTTASFILMLVATIFLSERNLGPFKVILSTLVSISTPTQITTPLPPTPIATLTPREQLEEQLLEAIRKLQGAQSLIGIPQEMTVEKTYRAVFRISKNNNQLQNNITTNLPPSITPNIQETKTGTLMRVRLIGDQFYITPITPEDQVVSDDTYTEWAWNVTPKTLGNLTLTLQSSARFNIQGLKEEQRNYLIKDTRVYVDSTLEYTIKSIFKDYWQVMLFIVISITGAVLSINRVYITTGLTPKQTRLKDFINSSFSDSELNELCFELGIDNEHLDQRNKLTKIISLIKYCNQRSMIEDLEFEVSRKRPSKVKPQEPDKESVKR